MNRFLPFLAAAALLLSGCAFTVSERDFLRPGTSVWPRQDPQPGTQRQTVQVRHADGNVSRGVFVQVPGAVATVLFFQGNGETIDKEVAVRAWQYERVPVNFYAFDRRGYGQTPGTPTAALLGTDAVDLFDHVRARTRGTLVVHGFSLGTTVASSLARQRPLDALVLEGASPSVPEYVNAHLPWYAKPFVRVQLAPELNDVNTVADLAAFKGPVLVAVGERDPDTKPELARALYDRIDSPGKELQVVAQAGHWALITPQGHELLAAFVRRVAAAR